MNVFDLANLIVSTCFENKFWAFAFVVGNVIIFIASSLTVLMIIARRRGLKEETRIRTLPEYPMISVVMTLKNTHARTEQYLIGKLSINYPGDLEFIVVTESREDPAYELASKVISNFQFSSDKRRDTKVTVAGLTWHNSQKIHNILHAISETNPDSKYVLLSDDDVYLYPGIIEELLDPILKEPDTVLLSTGYDFPIPPPGSSLHNYALVFFRNINLFSFITTRPILCWGGCQFGPLSLFRENFMHLIDCYLDGGYSDDNIISMLVQQKGKVCAHPARAIFPNELDQDTTFYKYWEYLCRQYFTLDTYCTGYSKSIGYSLAFLIVSSIWLMAMWATIAPWVGILIILSRFSTQWVGLSVMKYAAIFSIFNWIYIITSVTCSTKTMIKVSNSVRSPQDWLTYSPNYVKIFFGSCEQILVMPFAVLRIMFSNSIIWSGIKYYKENGKIVKVERFDKNGNPYSEMFSSSIARTIEQENYRRTFKNLLIYSLDEETTPIPPV